MGHVKILMGPNVYLIIIRKTKKVWIVDVTVIEEKELEKNSKYEDLQREVE